MYIITISGYFSLIP